MPIFSSVNPDDVGSQSWKYPVETGELTTNINLANPGTSTIGGGTLTQNDLVLIGGQTDSTENGIYVFDTSSTPMVRANVADTADKIDGAAVVVDNGTNEALMFTLDIDGTRTIGVDAIVVTQIGGTSTDELIKVSINDTTASVLINKVSAGTNISLAEINDGGNETLEISSTAGGTDELVKISFNDTTPNFLLTKVVAGTGIQVNELNDGSNETLEIVNLVTDTNTDETVKVSANDTTPSFLGTKLVSGSNINLVEQNDGANETLQVNVTGLGTGDVSGTGSSTDNAVVRWDGATGTQIQDSGVIISDADNVSGINILNVDTSTRIGHNFASPYRLSVQSNTAFTYIEILNDVGTNQGAFFGIENNGPGLTDQEFTLYNWQGGPIVFYTDTAASSGQKRFVIENDGTLNVSDQTNYENKVTDDDDIPNKKYVDDNDDSVKVSANDTTPGQLLTKLVAGNNIDLIENNDGGNETLTIDVEALTKADITDFVESDYVHTTGNETIAGEKTFTDTLDVDLSGTATFVLGENGANDALLTMYDNTGVTGESFQIASKPTGALLVAQGLVRLIEYRAANHEFGIIGNTAADTLFIENSDNDVLFLAEGDGRLRAQFPSYETLVDADDVLTNKKYVDDTIIAAASDQQVKVSSNDTTPSFLASKLVSGNNISFTINNPSGNETLTIDVDALTKSDITDFVEGDYVHTTGNESIAGVKTFTEDVPIIIDSPSTTGNLEIGYFNSVLPNCYGVRNSTASGYFCFMPNAANPQLVMGDPGNTTGSGFIDVDNNRPLNLNVLDTGAGTPAVVNIGSGGLNVNAGGDITLGASNTVDGVDVGSPKNSIVVDSNQYQLENDVLSPGFNKRYGTDATGTKGWVDNRSPLYVEVNALDFILGLVASPDYFIAAIPQLLFDATYGSLRILAYDDTSNEGAGYYVNIPPDALDVEIQVTSRATGAITGTDNVNWRIAFREITDDAAIGAWGDNDIGTYGVTNNNWQYQNSGTLTLASLSLNTNTLYQFQIYRNNTAVADNIVGDIYLLHVEFKFN